MATREIPRSEWRKFFDSFSRQHEGWLTTVEVVGGDIGDQFEATEMPLQGISADVKGSEPDAIEIAVGTGPADELTHIIPDASRVLFEQTLAGAGEGLEIESAAGERTIMRFRAAQQPELLDGVTDPERQDRTRKAGGGE